MSPSGPTPSPATAGMLVLTGLVLGVLAGLGVGSLVDATGPALVVGSLVGLTAGVVAVIVRFRDL